MDCDRINDSEQRETIQSIEDATGRLSNLVRLMEQNSKLIQPSDLTVQSYKSQSMSNNLQSIKADDIEDLEDQKISSLDKLDNFLVGDFSQFKNNNGDSSLEQT